MFGKMGRIATQGSLRCLREKEVAAVASTSPHCSLGFRDGRKKVVGRRKVATGGPRGAICWTPGPARSPVPTAPACDDSSRDKRSRLSGERHVTPRT